MKPWEVNYSLNDEKKKPWQTDYSTKPAAKPEPVFTPYANVRKDIDHKELYTDKSWLSASRELYRMTNNSNEAPKEWTDQELAEYGMNEISEFNWDITSMAFDTARIHGASQETKEAFLYALDQYDAVDHSWKTTGRAAKNLLQDPTTYAGLLTFGFGSASAQGAKIAGKEALKLTLREAIKQGAKRVGAAGVVSGAAEAVADSSMRQSIRVDAGQQDEFSYGQAAASAGIGAVTGLGLGVAADVTGTYVGKVINKLKKNTPDVDVKAKAPEVDRQGNVVVPTEPTTADINLAPEPVRAIDLVEDVALERGVDITDPKAKAELVEELTQLDKITDDLVDEAVDRPFAKGATVDPSNVVMFSQADNTIPTPDEVPQAAEVLFQKAKKEGAIEGLLERINRSIVQEDVAVVKDTVAAARQSADKRVLQLQNAINKSETGDKLALYLELEEALTARNNLNEVDAALAASSGRELQSRQKFGSPVADLNDVDAVERAAEKAFKSNIKEIEGAAKPKINEALNAGDNATAVRLMRERDETILAEYQKFHKDKPLEGDGTTFTGKFLEAQIGGVFSPSTVQFNVVWPLLKSVLYPALDVMTDPFDRASRMRAAKTYGAMRGALSGAVESARASWKFEQSFLTADPARFLEGGIQIKGKKGEFVRTFPRALAATDAFISEMATAGYLSGQAAEIATNEGIAKGLKGKELTKFVDAAIEKTMRDSYDRYVTEAAIEPIINKAKKLGLTGSDFDDYVLKALDTTDADALKRLTNDEAKSYINDVLYKRGFGEGNLDRGKAGEKLAEGVSSYEDFSSKHKLLKITGQLFLRTPIRVFEEGLRLTPAVQILMPNFTRDLAGRNGAARQARAQAEIMVGNAVVMYAIQAWAKGELKGSGDSDWKRAKLVGDSDELPRLSIGSDDGSSKSFQRLDPLRIPLTIVADMLDGAMTLTDRELQGEDHGNKLLQGSSLAMATVVSLFRDAALFSGVTEAFEFGEKIMDVLTDETKGLTEAGSAISNFIYDKAAMTVPATAKKAAKSFDGNNVLANADTVQQKIGAMFLPSANFIPKQYDVHGNVRTNEDNEENFLPFFNLTTYDERAKGRSAKELYVSRALNEMMAATDQRIGEHPETDVRFGSEKLTEIMTTVDGIEMPVFDAMMIEYKRAGITNLLHTILKSNAPVGTPMHDGTKTSLVKNTISKVRKQALDLVISRDPKLKALDVEYKRSKARTQAGQFDLNPYK